MTRPPLPAFYDDLDASFADVEAASIDCRFANCTHTGEPGCAIQRAIAQGELGGVYMKLKDYKQGIPWLQKGAEGNDANAQRQLGVAYFWAMTCPRARLRASSGCSSPSRPTATRKPGRSRAR